MISEDLLERKADLMTLQSLEEIESGLDTPIDDLLQMIEEDSNASEKSGAGPGAKAKGVQ